MKLRNPYNVEHRTIGRFRGVASPELGAVLPDPFTGDSLNMVSVVMGELGKRVGAVRSSKLAVAGDFLGIGYAAGGSVLAVGTVILAEAENRTQEVPLEDLP